MDSYLQHLKREALANPSLKDAYIHALERCVGGVGPAADHGDSMECAISGNLIKIKHVTITDPYEGTIEGHPPYKTTSAESPLYHFDRYVRATRELAESRCNAILIEEPLSKGTSLIDPVVEKKWKNFPLFKKRQVKVYLEHWTEDLDTIEVLTLIFFPSVLDLKLPINIMIGVSARLQKQN